MKRETYLKQSFILSQCKSLLLAAPHFIGSLLKLGINKLLKPCRNPCQSMSNPRLTTHLEMKHTLWWNNLFCLCAVLGGSNSFYQLEHLVDIDPFLTKDTALCYSSELIFLTPPSHLVVSQAFSIIGFRIA